MMNIKYKIFILLLFISTRQLYSQDNNSIDSLVTLYKLNSKMITDWKLDTNGCKSLRGMYLNEIESNKLLVGMPKKLFISFFGNPDSKVDEGFYCYGVYSDCEKLLKNGKFMDFMSLTVLFKDEQVLSISTRITER